MSEPLISVIVPVYNAEKYIEKCVASIRAQTYRNLDANCNNKLSIQLVRSLLFEEDPAQLRREP